MKNLEISFMEWAKENGFDITLKGYISYPNHRTDTIMNKYIADGNIDKMVHDIGFLLRSLKSIS